MPRCSQRIRPRGGRLCRNSKPQRAGDRLSAFNAEISIDTDTATANCLYNWPVIPGMNADGTKTENTASVIAMIGPVTSAIAASVAAAGVNSGCVSNLCSTASTTTIASSTTMPIASTSANSDTVLAEKPSASMTAKVPISATGTAMMGISVARKLPRKMKTTIATSTKASISVWITLSMVASTNTVVSYMTL